MSHHQPGLSRGAALCKPGEKEQPAWGATEGHRWAGSGEGLTSPGQARGGGTPERGAGVQRHGLQRCVYPERATEEAGAGGEGGL